jgi:hypothetical protein
MKPLSRGKENSRIGLRTFYHGGDDFERARRVAKAPEESTRHHPACTLGANLTEKRNQCTRVGRVDAAKVESEGGSHVGDLQYRREACRRGGQSCTS